LSPLSPPLAVRGRRVRGHRRRPGSCQAARFLPAARFLQSGQVAAK
jgi:hypothetical protein